LTLLVSAQVSVIGLYLPPVFTELVPPPPQIIISLPVHTAVCDHRPVGGFIALVAIQLSVLGL
jgi:hypothetical protein